MTKYRSEQSQFARRGDLQGFAHTVQLKDDDQWAEDKEGTRVAAKNTKYVNMDGTLGFIGGGQMAQALIGGILKANVLPADRFIVSDPTEGQSACYSAAHVFLAGRNAVSALGVTNVTSDNSEVFAKAQVLHSVTAEVSPLLTKDCVPCRQASYCRNCSEGGSGGLYWPC